MKKPTQAIAKGVFDKHGKFETIKIERKALKDHDVLIKIRYSGICHSDIHHVRDEWKFSTAHYPMIPGHEIAGEVADIGDKVTKFKIGDYIGVGCMVNSCRHCEECQAGYEQQCPETIWTYNTPEPDNNNKVTYGGYSNYLVVTEDFGIKVPKDAPLEYVAPLMCAGITTYAPLVFSKVKPHDKVAIAGFGGLGVMAIKYAQQFGAQTYVIARNNRKQKLADELGVSKYYSSVDDVDEKFDLIISTIPTGYDVTKYIKCLKVGGEIAILGIPPSNEKFDLNLESLLFDINKKVYGSMIGGIQLTQEMLDFSLKHKIYPEIEIISADQIDEAYDNLTSGKAKFRYVIDISTLK